MLICYKNCRFKIFFFILLFMLVHGEKVNIFNLTETSGKFFENGSPLVTTTLEKQIFTEKLCRHYPQFTVVESHLTNEGNTYIQVDDVANVNFYLWEQIHPKSPNYKYNVSANSVEKCSGLLACEIMNYCKFAKIFESENETVSNRTVFISWKINKDFLIFLLQYQNQIISCQDTNKLDIKKIVLSSNVKLNYKISKESYTYMDETTNLINLSSSYLFYISHCFTCSFDIIVKCPNYINQTISTNNSLPPVVYTDAGIFGGWKKIIVGLQGVVCTMETKLESNQKWSLNKFWALTVIRESEKNMSENDKKPEKACDRINQPTKHKKTDACAETTNNIFNHNKTIGRFFENGGPLVTLTLENQIFNTIKEVKLFPNFTEIENELGNEGNLYVQIEKVNNTEIILEANLNCGFYKYNALFNSIEKCFGLTECKKLEQCRFAIIKDFENANATISEKTVFMSWKIKNNYLKLLFQYKNYIVLCEDTNEVAIDKIVLFSNTEQHYATSKGTFVYLNRTSNEIIKNLVNLNTAYSFYIYQCLACSFDITVICPNYQIQTIATNTSSRVDYSNNVIFEGWKKVIVGLKNVNCVMNISTKFEKIWDQNEFWAITLIKESNQNMIIKHNQSSVNITKNISTKSGLGIANQNNSSISIFSYLSISISLLITIIISIY